MNGSGVDLEVESKAERGSQPVAETTPSNPPERTGASARWLLLPVFLSLVYLVTIAYIGRTHTFGNYATETDFYHLYAPDAERIAAGQFPENPFQGPGYPALLALLGQATGDLFTAGKWLSIVSAALVGLLVFFLFEQLFSYWVGVGAQLLVYVSGEFPEFAINAATDIFFLLICLACLVALFSRWLTISPRNRIILVGVLTGVAYLTRYNGLFLFAVAIFGIVLFDLFGQTWRRRLELAAIFTAVFILTASPWFYANYKHRGSPLYNDNYLNIATEFYPELAKGKVNQDGTRVLSEMFRSFGDVLRYDPKRILAHYPVNLLESLKLSVKADLVGPLVSWFAFFGIALALALRRTKPIILLLISGVLYLLLMALNHWETRYYFYLMVLYIGFAVFAVVGLYELARARGWLKPRALVLIPISLIALLWFTSLTPAKANIVKFLSRQPHEVMIACEYFKREQITGSRVIARKPHIAYVCGQQWVFLPEVKSLDEFHQWLQENPVDYIVISSIELARRKELESLKKPETAPAWLKPVQTSQEPVLVLYKTELNRSGKPSSK